MENKIAIVIGVSGMDGETATRFLLNKNYKVISTYRRNTQILENELYTKFNYHNNLKLQFCDINDRYSVDSLFKNTLKDYGKIDEIYLLAAQSHVGKSFQSPEQTVLTNGMSAYYFLENIRILTPTTKIYFAATSELLGGDPKRCPFDENSVFECRSPYSIGKELAVRWIEYYKQTYNIFGSYGILFNHSSCLRNKDFFIRKVTNTAARIAIGKEQNISLGNINFYRDEHWSDFGVEAMWKILQLDNPDKFIICRGECFHGEQFLDTTFNYFNLDWKKYVKLDKDLLRPNEVIKLVGNPQKAIDKLHWKPNRMPFKDHIELMCKYDYELESDKKPILPNVFELYP